MESKERLIRFFEGKEIDRLPIWLLFPYHNVEFYADVYNTPCYKPIVDRISKGDCDTFDRRGCNTKMLFTSCDDLVFNTNTVMQGDTKIWTNELKYKDIKFTKTIKTNKNNSSVDFYIDDPSELYRLLEIPYVPVRPNLDIYRKEREELGNKGFYMMDLCDPLVPLYYLMSAESFSIATVTDYPVLLEFLDVIYERVLDTYRYFLDNDVADCYFIVGCELAGPPLVSPKKFGEMSERYVKGICDLIRSYGKKSIVHYHGNLYQVLGNFKKIGMDALHTIEAPPIGDCTIAQAQMALGKQTALIGNVQYDDIIRLTKGEIEQQVKEAVEQAGDGKLIISPTAGPYEKFIDDHAVANYLAFIDSALKYSKR